MKQTLEIQCELDPTDKLKLTSDLGGIVFKTTNGSNVHVNKAELLEIKELIEQVL